MALDFWARRFRINPATFKMNPHIKLKLYATLQAFMPAEGEAYPISPGMTVKDILNQLKLPVEKAKLIFIDGMQADLSSRLEGGERLGIFPPVGGG
jgi:sulfur carrier protein ThiS